MLVFNRARDDVIFIKFGDTEWDIAIIQFATDETSVTIFITRMGPNSTTFSKRVRMSRGDEQMLIPQIKITILDIREARVRVGITSPKDAQVHRKEIWSKLQRENKAASDRAEDGDNLDGLSGAVVPRPKPPSSFSPGQALEEPTPNDDDEN